MNLQDKIKSTILSNVVPEKERKVGLEIEGLYYNNQFRRLPVNTTNEYSASDLLADANDLLKPDDVFSYSLEPGGQLEWASGPAVSLWDIEAQYNRHLSIENQLCANHDLGRLYLSLEPICTPDDIDLIQMNKYQLMNDLFRQSGKFGPWMMRNTTSVQVNVDFTSEEDANEMAFVADAIQPLFSILFSNTPFMNGAPVGTANMRWRIWEDTDPGRCGSLFSHSITNPHQMVDEYSNWIQSVKTIFQYTPDGDAIAHEGSLKKMIMDNPDETEYHIVSALHQSFTHVRYKSVLEVRAGDRPQKGYELSPAAFLLGLLTAPSTRKDVFEIVKQWSDLERKQLDQTAKDISFENIGPNNTTVGDWLSTLGGFSLRGLDERSAFFNIKSERPILEPILNNLLVNGPKTKQIQNAYKKVGGPLDRFLLDCCLESASQER